MWLELICFVLWCLGLWLVARLCHQPRGPVREAERPIVMRLGRACWGRPGEGSIAIRDEARWTA